MAEVINGILIREVETKNIMTKSSLPVGGYSVNPYVGCTHACKYCYASFMKRFTGHTEEWGTFLDVKHWPEIKNPKKYAGQRVVIGSVTDGYNPQEEQFGNTRKLLEQLIGSDADILICTKSDLVVRDIDLLKKLGRVTVSWSINTLDENFKNDMDSASSIERRIAAMKQVYDAGIRTVCFVSPVFPGITDFEAIFERVRVSGTSACWPTAYGVRRIIPPDGRNRHKRLSEMTVVFICSKTKGGLFHERLFH